MWEFLQEKYLCTIVTKNNRYCRFHRWSHPLDTLVPKKYPPPLGRTSCPCMTYHSFISSWCMESTSGIKALRVSGWVSNIWRKVTVPTCSMLDWRANQDSRRRAFCSSVSCQRFWNREQIRNGRVGTQVLFRLLKKIIFEGKTLLKSHMLQF